MHMDNPISIHALLAESDEHAYQLVLWVLRFLSTLSLRRATVWIPLDDGSLFISIHALLAESDGIATKYSWSGFSISIHALLAESDALRSPRIALMVDFYPRSPCGERPHIRSTSSGRRGISIHALLAESDCKKFYAQRILSDFYPRSPCGERPTTIITICIALRFLSTLSLRRATHIRSTSSGRRGISIHALLAESDAIQHTEIDK